jgi:hypothetical protein
MPEVVYAAALAYRRAGCSVLPIAGDGSKRPAARLLPKVWDPYERRWKPTWKPLQSQISTEAELRHWFAQEPVGLALIGGRISGGLEILDFDAIEVYGPWCQKVEALCPGLLGRLPVTQTPDDGRHVYYRCQAVDGNLKLAQHPGFHGKPEVLIETRGEGGYAIVPPSPPACHPSSRPYVLLQGHLAKIPLITPDERTILLTAARSFNAYVPPERVVVGLRAIPSQPTTGNRPGDLFNRHATWPDILEPHGWSRAGQRGEVILWRRPDKRLRGSSATTNYGGSNLLHVFSSNAFPFDQDTAYSKFTAYVLLEHGGDFHVATRMLARKGYRPPKVGEIAPPLTDPWLGPRWRLHGISLAVRRIGEGVTRG